MNTSCTKGDANVRVDQSRYGSYSSGNTIWDTGWATGMLLFLAHGNAGANTTRVVPLLGYVNNRTAIASWACMGTVRIKPRPYTLISSEYYVRQE